MADNNIFDHEDEYRPTEQNTSSAYGATPTKSNGFNSPLLKRGFLAVMLLVISAGLIKCHHSSKSKPSESKPAVVQTQKSVNTATTKTTTAVKTISPAASVAQPSTSAAVPPMPSPIEVANQKIAQLEAKINTLEAGLTDINAKFATLVNVMQNLNNQLAQQQNQVQLLLARQTAIQKSTLKKGVAKYTIQAMLPGRAWLITNSGSVMSVRLGEQLPGYGTIDTMDPVEGKILTSSGRIIEYKDS
jgi:intracellular multiplication protein IcmG